MSERTWTCKKCGTFQGDCGMEDTPIRDIICPICEEEEEKGE